MKSTKSSKASPKPKTFLTTDPMICPGDVCSRVGSLMNPVRGQKDHYTCCNSTCSEHGSVFFFKRPKYTLIRVVAGKKGKS